MADLGRVGIWTRQLDSQSARVAQDAAADLEALGYPALWIPEAFEREVISHAALLLAGTSTITVATGIANVHARAARAAALAQLMLTERFPGRFVLGLGVSHPVMVERVLHQDYGAPLPVMRDYLDEVDAVLERAARCTSCVTSRAPPRGPRSEDAGAGGRALARGPHLRRAGRAHGVGARPRRHRCADRTRAQGGARHRRVPGACDRTMVDRTDDPQSRVPRQPRAPRLHRRRLRRGTQRPARRRPRRLG